MSVNVRLLGSFEVAVNGVPVADDAWTRRHAASLVKLLALAPERRLHREQVMDALWPGLTVDAAGPRLHKAAHYARRAMGDEGASLVLRNDMVALRSEGTVAVDVDRFTELAARALAEGDRAAAAAALTEYGGALLPEDLYEPWTDEPRDKARRAYLDLLRLAEEWERLVDEDPTDESAHLALIRASSERGDVRGALRQFERLDQALRRELGTAPSVAAERLRAQLETRAHLPHHASPDVHRRTKLFGRRDVADRVRERIVQAEGGRGGTLLVSGPPGVGKSAVLDLAEASARARGWRTGRGTASMVEGPWPYAPVLEALSDLCRKHPALLDGLDDVYRTEIERALSGRDVAWSGESGHQRLFVAAAELTRLASAGHGLLLVVDDIHEADEASLRLIHYLSRCAMTEPVLLALAHRTHAPESMREVTESLVARGTGTRIDLEPLTEAATRRLLLERFPDLDPQRVERIWAASAGLPFAILELARSGDDPAPSLLPNLPGGVITAFQRVALLGPTFTTDELLAVVGLPEEEAYRCLGAALESLVVEAAESGFRFRHALVREALLEAMSPIARSAAEREIAEALADLGEPPARVASAFLAAGLPARAVPYVLRAVETAGALGAYRDALALIDGVRAYASDADLPRLLARRGDLLMALGDPQTIDAYREALTVTEGSEHRLVRARLARAAGFVGDFDTARSAVAGGSLEGDVADGPMLLALGNLAYFTGDIDAAWDLSVRAREMLQAPDDPWQLVDMVSLQGLIAHHRGDWFERFRMELKQTQGRQRLAGAVADAHLCVAEYVLYGPVPYADVIAETEELRRRAEHLGALRGVAFATALIGEAALLMGDLDRAERELLEAVDLHRDIDASAGQAHSLQRLAEVHVARGDRSGARELLERALPLARWSVISLHLLQRIHGTLIAAAPDPVAARGVVDRAEATLAETDRCAFCDVMLAAPAAIACADVGDIEDAYRHLAIAEQSAARWEGTAWPAAVLEARSHVAAAEGNDESSTALLTEAASLFRLAGQPLDAERCAAAKAAYTPA
jgi:DNA-binding SARP family transcriptional activator